jgi:hypothetical protein
MRLQSVRCGEALGSDYNTCFHLTGDRVNCLIDCGASSLPALRKLGIARAHTPAHDGMIVEL